MTASSLGATPLPNGRCCFRVWAPYAKEVQLHLTTPRQQLVSMDLESRVYHAVSLDDVGPGARYFFRLDGEEDLPDPASRFQPEGVHGPSEVVSLGFDWTDATWRRPRLEDLIFYELHVGTFTEGGTFEDIVPDLDRLVDLGVTAVELMPVAQFSGTRNWGYDGVYPFAVQASYGGPTGLKRLVDACHAKGLAVVLDVVYNHLGPEGNYFGKFGPYFTERYRTPWGEALNFDGPWSDEVRRYFIDNALYWIDAFHIDGLRLDAVHSILDASPYTFLEQLVEAVGTRAPREAFLIPESAANDARLIRSRELGGYGLDAQWNDDFHHALRVLLTGERQGYYQDYSSRLDQLEKAYRTGFVYTGQYSSYRRRRHGSEPVGVPRSRFVVFAQNHDQVGNRLLGDRLAGQVEHERLKLAATAVILSPFLPLLFMGEEYGETALFPYFVSHSDAELLEAVRKGRREEFAAFGWKEEPPDPGDEATFRSAVLNREAMTAEPHRTLLAFYRELLALRKREPMLGSSTDSLLEVRRFDRERVLCLRRGSLSGDGKRFEVLLHFGKEAVTLRRFFPDEAWRPVLDSAEERFGGPGSTIDPNTYLKGDVTLGLPPWAALVLVREEAFDA